MKRSTLILFIVFALLGTATAWILSSKGESDSTLVDNWDGNFKVEDADVVHKVFIADRKGNQTTLERKDGYWLYDGKYKAHPNKIENVLDVIEQMEIRYIPPDAAIEPIVKDLATNALKIELFDQAGEKLKSYYMGGTTPDALGTFMIMEGSDQPYVMQVPSFEGSLNVRFLIKGDDWRDKTLFDYDPDKIEYISLEYPKQRNKSFILERTGDGFKVEPFYDVTPRINKPLNEGKVLAYLERFSGLYMAAYENDNPFREEFEQERIPFVKIKVKHDGKEKEAILHPAKSSNMSKPNAPIEYYMTEVEPGDDFVSLTHESMKKIFWAYEFFFE